MTTAHAATGGVQDTWQEVPVVVGLEVLRRIESQAEAKGSQPRVLASREEDAVPTPEYLHDMPR